MTVLGGLSKRLRCRLDFTRERFLLNELLEIGAKVVGKCFGNLGINIIINMRAGKTEERRWGYAGVGLSCVDLRGQHDRCEQ